MTLPLRIGPPSCHGEPDPAGLLLLGLIVTGPLLFGIIWCLGTAWNWIIT